MENLSATVMPLQTKITSSMVVVGSQPQAPVTIEVKISVNLNKLPQDNMYSHTTVILCECPITNLKIGATFETAILATGNQDEIFSLIKSQIHPMIFEVAETQIHKLCVFHGLNLHIPISQQLNDMEEFDEIPPEEFE